MKYKFINNIQIGGLIKDDFLYYLNNKEFDNITNEMIQLVNDTFTIQGEEHYLLIYFLNKYKNNIIIWLLNLPNIDVNIQDNNGNSPLHLAFKLIYYNNVINLLLNNQKININIQDNNGNTPLHIAFKSTYYRYNNILILINNQTININIQDNDGNTPLHLAILHLANDFGSGSGVDKYEIMKELINKTNLTIINKSNLTILSLFCYNKMYINTNEMLYYERGLMTLILNKYIENNINISEHEYLYITCWSTIDNITLSIFNEFITKYHNKFPDLKLRSDKALQYYNIYSNENNNKQYIINAHGSTLDDYFIIPSNIMIIMQTPINEFAYQRRFNISNPNIMPPCYINKNHNEYINSILKINPYVYMSGSLMKNNNISFYAYDKTYFRDFMGILNIKQITKENFELPQSYIDFINNWTSNNENEQDDFILKYTDIDIFSIDIIKQNNLTLSDIVRKIKELYPTNYIILYVPVCRKCNENEDFNDICPNIIEQTSLLKNPKRRGSFSLSSTNIDNLLLSNHNNFQKIYDSVINLTNNIDLQNLNTYNLSNNNICDILSEYLKIKIKN